MAVKTFNFKTLLVKEEVHLTHACNPKKKNDMHASVADDRVMALAKLSLDDMDKLWEQTTREEFEFTVLGFSWAITK